MGPISAGDCLLASLVCVLRWQLTLEWRRSGGGRAGPARPAPGTAASLRAVRATQKGIESPWVTLVAGLRGEASFCLWSQVGRNLEID